jgi:hypothetical protein
MRRMGIAALAPQPGTSQRCPGHKVYPYPKTAENRICFMAQRSTL